MTDKLFRVCPLCHQEIDLCKKYDGSYVKIKSVYYHCSCWSQRKMNLKRKAWSQQRCDEYLNSLKPDTRCIVKEIYYKVKINKWMLDFYQATYFPSCIYVKLQSVYDGTYKSLQKPIPIWDIYDMFVRQSDNLKKINRQLIQKNARKGVATSITQLFSYDLAVILAKYDSYVEWKEQNKQEQKRLKTIAETHIDYEAIYNPKLSDNKSININDILDDI